MKKIALITGGTSGIGKACAERFLTDGYKVIVTGRRQERLLEFQALYGENDVCILNFDVRDNNQVVDALQSLPEDWKNIRTEKYWDTFYSIQYPKEYNYYGLFYYDIDLRLEYTLKCVRYYLKHIKKEMPG